MLQNTGTYVVEEDGFIFARCAVGATVIDRPLYRFKINTMPVQIENTGHGGAYTYYTSPIYPVKKDDMVYVSVASFMDNHLFFCKSST